MNAQLAIEDLKNFASRLQNLLAFADKLQDVASFETHLKEVQASLATGKIEAGCVQEKVRLAKSELEESKIEAQQTIELAKKTHSAILQQAEKDKEALMESASSKAEQILVEAEFNSIAVKNEIKNLMSQKALITEQVEKEKAALAEIHAQIQSLKEMLK